MKKILKHLLFIFSVFCILCFMFALVINIYMFSFTKNYIFSELKDVPMAQVSMILGAGVSTTGTISLAARDRVEAAMELYHSGKTEKVMISGDHGRKNYDEVNSMKNYIKNMYHIANKDIFLDHAGFSTYESLYRGRDVFLMDDVIVISQKFHLPRAIYIARKLGLNAVGYAAKEIAPLTKATHTIWNIREFLARVKSFFLVTFDIKPTYLGETIPISGDGRNSWD